jgi:hypothetical protein
MKYVKGEDGGSNSVISLKSWGRLNLFTSVLKFFVNIPSYKYYQATRDWMITSRPEFSGLIPLTRSIFLSVSLLCVHYYSRCHLCVLWWTMWILTIWCELYEYKENKRHVLITYVHTRRQLFTFTFRPQICLLFERRLAKEIVGTRDRTSWVIWLWRRILRNVGNCLPLDTAEHRRRLESSATPLWDPYASRLD